MMRNMIWRGIRAIQTGEELGYPILRSGASLPTYSDDRMCPASPVLYSSDALRPDVVQLATGAWYDPEDPAAPALYACTQPERARRAMPTPPAGARLYRPARPDRDRALYPGPRRGSRHSTRRPPEGQMPHGTFRARSGHPAASDQSTSGVRKPHKHAIGCLRLSSYGCSPMIGHHGRRSSRPEFKRGECATCASCATIWPSG